MNAIHTNHMHYQIHCIILGFFSFLVVVPSVYIKMRSVFDTMTRTNVNFAIHFYDVKLTILHAVNFMLLINDSDNNKKNSITKPWISLIKVKKCSLFRNFYWIYSFGEKNVFPKWNKNAILIDSIIHTNNKVSNILIVIDNSFFWYFLRLSWKFHETLHFNRFVHAIFNR